MVEVVADDVLAITHEKNRSPVVLVKVFPPADVYWLISEKKPDTLSLIPTTLKVNSFWVGSTGFTEVGLTASMLVLT